MDERNKTSLFGKGGNLFFLVRPFPLLLFCTPKYTLQAPHAIVACITPGSCQMYSITFVSPFTFLSLVIVCVLLSGVLNAAN